MDWRRFSLFIAITGVIYFAFLYVYLFPYQKQTEAYRRAQAAKRRAIEAEATTGTRAADVAATGTLPSDVESTSPTAVAEPEPVPLEPDRAPTSITIETHLYRVILTSRGGRPASWQYFDRLPGHDEAKIIEMIPQRGDIAEPERELPLEAIVKENNRRWYPQFNNRVLDHEVRTLQDGSREVVFTTPEVGPFQLIKTYRFRPNDYLTSFQVVLKNLDKTATVRINDDDHGVGISWGPGMREYAENQQAYVRFTNAVYGREGFVGYSKPTDPRKEARSGQYDGDVYWAGATDTYFLAAVIPSGFRGRAVRTFVRRSNEYPKGAKGAAPPFTIVLHNERFDLPPGSQVTLDYSLFVGPKRPRLLAEVARRTGAKMQQVLFYDYWFHWMRALKLGLTHMLAFFHTLLGNYGVAIVVMTLLIRVVMHPIAHKGMKIQAKAMAEMQKIKPLLDEVNKKHKGDPARRNQETMALYREHGISPFAPLRGCLPMLIQIPIFFALYDLLYQSIDLRGAGFLWIEDLSGPDRLIDLTRYGLDFRIPLFGWHVASVNILPILMGVSQHIMSKMTPTPTADATQKQMMMMFTLMFPILMYNFPSGLFIYWLINNVWQSVHQILAKRGLKKTSEGKVATAK